MRKLFFLFLIFTSFSFSNDKEKIAFFIDNSGSMLGYQEDGSAYRKIFEKLQPMLIINQDFKDISIYLFGESIRKASKDQVSNLGFLSCYERGKESVLFTDKKTKLSEVPEFIIRNNFDLAIILSDAEADEMSKSTSCTAGYDLSCFSMEINKLTNNSYNFYLFGFKSKFNLRFLSAPGNVILPKKEGIIQKGLYFMIFYKNSAFSLMQHFITTVSEICKSNNIEYLLLNVFPYNFPDLNIGEERFLRYPEKFSDKFLTPKDKEYKELFFEDKSKILNIKIDNSIFKENFYVFKLKEKPKPTDKILLEALINLDYKEEFMEDKLNDLYPDAKIKFFSIDKSKKEDKKNKDKEKVINLKPIEIKGVCKSKIIKSQNNTLYFFAELSNEITSSNLLKDGLYLMLEINLRPVDNAEKLRRVLKNWSAESAKSEEYLNGGTLKLIDLIEILNKQTIAKSSFSKNVYIVLEKI